MFVLKKLGSSVLRGFCHTKKLLSGIGILFLQVLRHLYRNTPSIKLEGYTSFPKKCSWYNDYQDVLTVFIGTIYLGQSG